MRIIGETNIPFLSYRKIALTLSALAIAGGLAYQFLGPGLNLGIKIAVEKIQNRAREVTLLAPWILDPDQNLVLLRLIEALNGRSTGREFVDRGSQQTEVWLFAEFESHLCAADEVDAEVEPRSEELVGQSADDRQR